MTNGVNRCKYNYYFLKDKLTNGSDTKNKKCQNSKHKMKISLRFPDYLEASRISFRFDDFF